MGSNETDRARMDSSEVLEEGDLIYETVLPCGDSITAEQGMVKNNARIIVRGHISKAFIVDRQNDNIDAICAFFEQLRMEPKDA